MQEKEIDPKALMVRGIPPGSTPLDIKQAFDPYGAIRVHLPEVYKNDGESFEPKRYKDFAFVHFATKQQADSALKDASEIFIKKVMV